MGVAKVRRVNGEWRSIITTSDDKEVIASHHHKYIQKVFAECKQDIAAFASRIIDEKWRALTVDSFKSELLLINFKRKANQEDKRPANTTMAAADVMPRTPVAASSTSTPQAPKKRQHVDLSGDDDEEEEETGGGAASPSDKRRRLPPIASDDREDEDDEEEGDEEEEDEEEA